MDTRFWGPDAWPLLHLIASAPSHTAPSAVLRWFLLLEFVLPCKYCRTSFHDYLRLQPLTLAIINDRAAFSRWMYQIHNRVNAKLRGQGLLTAADPTWPTVRDRYTAMHDGLCTKPMMGWKFLCAIAQTTPARSAPPPTPMPDYDPTEHPFPMDLNERNRYNLLTRDERISALRAWWALLPLVLPCEPWRRAWSRVLPPLDAGPTLMRKWMWKMEESVCRDLGCPTPHPSCAALTREVSTFESGCSNARRGKTCRKQRKMKKAPRATRRK